MAKNPEIRPGTGGSARRCSTFDENIREGTQDHREESDDFGGPNESDPWDKELQKQWEDYPSHCSSSGSDTRGETSSSAEIVTDHCDGRGKHESRSNASEDAKNNDKVPELCEKTG